MRPRPRRGPTQPGAAGCPDRGVGARKRVFVAALAIVTSEGHDLEVKSRVHPKYKTKYRVGNWPAYDRALVQRVLNIRAS